MKWIIDTNVISELARKAPAANVVEWFTSQAYDKIAVSVVSIAEIRHGIAAAVEPEKKQQVAIWLTEVVRPMFDGRVLDINEDVLVKWQQLADSAKFQMRTLPQADSLIAATAANAGYGVCTRDTKPYLICGVPTLNPFTGERFNGA